MNKGFFIEVSNGLISPQHYEQMGDSVWLFMWFLDKITTIKGDEGKVLGGKPIKHKEVKEDLGITRLRYYRWIKRLEDCNYISTFRTTRGICFTVKKAKKVFKKEVKNCIKNDTSLPENCIKNDTSLPENCIKNDTSLPENCIKNDTSLPENCIKNDTSLDPFCIKNDTSNKTKHSTDKSEYIIDPSGPDHSEALTGKEFTMVEKDNPPSPPAVGPTVNDAIALFLPLLPGDFIGARTAFAKPPTREAVAALLKRYSLEEIKELIRKYTAGQSDPFRPQVGTVYEFCTTKLAKIEAFVSKSAGGLWAQKPISSPEHRAESQKQMLKIIEHGREQNKIAKEKWEKEHSGK